MHSARHALLAFGLFMLGACATAVPQPKRPAPPAPTRPVPAPQPPAPARTPAPPPTPAAPLPALPPEPAKWIDAPRTPGDWTYTGGPSRTIARFGVGTGADFAITCDWTSRSVQLSRTGASSGPVLMRILTETGNELVDAQVAPDRAAAIATLPGGARVLDAMAFSRGRFAVETTGMPTLYLPSWAEVTRVVEDCR